MVANTAMRQQQRTLDAVRDATGLTRFETLNLGRQFADVGVSLASGQAIWMVAIQQGAQIGEVFAEARTRGVGFAGALGSIGRMLAPVLAFLGPIALAAGAVGSAFALTARDINSANSDIVSDLGLTEKQMERLKESGETMGITMGDVFRGIGTTIKEVLAEAFGPQIDQAQNAWGNFLDYLGFRVMTETRRIVGFFTGAYWAVTATWSLLPAAIGDAAYTAARAAIGAVEWMVNKGIDGVNRLIGAMRALSAINPAFAPARGLGSIDHVSLGQPGNRFAGGMSAFGAAGQAGFSSGYARGASWVNDAADRLRGNIQDSARARLRGAAGDADADAAEGGPAGREAKAVEERLRRIEGIDLKPLRNSIVEVVDPLKLIAEELRLIDDLARDMSQGLASAFGQSGQALGDLLTAMSGYQSRMAEIDLAEREARLSAMAAERERSQAQIQNYGDMAAAARGFFAEGSDGYRALLAVEQVYRAFQLAGMMQSMIMGQQETASTVAGSLARGAANAAEGASKMFAMLGPFAFPAVAAMFAVLAAVGLRSGGGGGGSYSPSNDNGGAATDALRGQTAREVSARQAGAAAFAQSVKVAVEFDDPMFRARVTKETAPLAGAAYTGAVQTSRETIPAEQTRKSNMTLRAGRR